MVSTIALEWKQTGKPKYFTYNGHFAQGVRGRVVFNGITLQECGGSGSSVSSNAPQYFLKSGTNLLKLEVLEYVPSGDKEAVEIRFHALEEPGFPDDANRAAYILIKPEELKAPLYREYSFELKEVPESKLLAAAEPMAAVTSADRQAIEAIFVELITALKATDLDAFKKLIGRAFQDQEECNYSSGGKLMATVERSFPDYTAAYADAGFDLSQMRLAHAMGGRIWFLTGGKGGPFLYVDTNEGYRTGMNLGVSKVAGQWILSRTLGGAEPVPPRDKKFEEMKKEAAASAAPKPETPKEAAKPAAVPGAQSGTRSEADLYQEIEKIYSSKMDAASARNVVNNIRNSYNALAPEQRRQGLESMLIQLNSAK